MILSSTPSFREFNPTVIPFQKRVLRDLLTRYNYELGTHEILLSGSVGSAKSILMAHVVLLHCLRYRGARVLLGRRALPDLKSTIYAKILEHMEGYLVEGRDYTKHDGSAFIKFANGSQIISRSWADNRFSKVRSLELSAACIEELTETEEAHAYNEIKMRVGRLPHIRENFIISATNPDSPSHWAYKYFITAESETRHVYYSITEQNPYLPRSYIEQLKRDLDPKMARRMLFGEWIEIANEVVYYAYDTTTQYLRDTEYKPHPTIPIWISWDFNIGEGKPLSVVAGQLVNGTVHVFKEWVIEGMRTEESCEEIFESGILSHPGKIYLTGDAAGTHRDTRSKRSDYDIIKKYMSNLETKIDWELFLTPANPPVRLRHNKVNALCKNDLGETRLYVYKGCKTVDEGLRLTQLKKSGQYIEDDSKYYQHCTTSLGYMCVNMTRPKRENRTIIL